jgi:tRNA 2-thiouridine synthesizing protein A
MTQSSFLQSRPFGTDPAGRPRHLDAGAGTPQIIAGRRLRQNRRLDVDQSQDGPARRLDCLGLRCPLPALHTRRALAGLAPGALLVVECDDPVSAIDIPHLVRETGDSLDSVTRLDARFVFAIRKAPLAGAPAGPHLKGTSGET